MPFQNGMISEGASASVILKKIDSAIDALETISLNCVIDASGQIISANDAFARLLGMSREEVLHKSLIPTLRDMRQLRTVVQVIRSLKSNEQFRGEVRVSLPAGARWFDVHVIPRHDVDAHLSGAVIILMDVTERKLMHEALAYHAFHDVLTGLPNRRLLMDRMMQARYRSDRFHEMFAIFFLDLDHFKGINDTYGHSAGDAVLVEVARRLREALRRDDTVCRQGGDEFILLLPGLQDEDGLPMIAEKLIQRIGEPISFEGQTLRVGASIGVSIYPDDGEDRERLIQMADRALYQAKESGRNRFVLFREMSTERAPAEPHDEVAAIFPAFEPIFRCADMKLTGFNIHFSRDPSFRSRTGGSRQVFRISEAGLARLFDRVFEAYLAWNDGRGVAVQLMFHLSGRDLARPHVLPALHEAAKRAGIPLDRIALSVRSLEPTPHPEGVPAIRVSGPPSPS